MTEYRRWGLWVPAHVLVQGTVADSTARISLGKGRIDAQIGMHENHQKETESSEAARVKTQTAEGERNKQHPTISLERG